MLTFFKSKDIGMPLPNLSSNMASVNIENVHSHTFSYKFCEEHFQCNKFRHSSGIFVTPPVCYWESSQGKHSI